VKSTVSWALTPRRIRNVFAGLMFLACLGPGVCEAQFGVPWRQVPSIVVVGAADDPRNALVDEAISYWNQVLEGLGSGFRLPAARHVVQAVPEEALQSLSQLIPTQPRAADVPAALRDLPGGLTIVLGNSDFVSFAGPFFDAGSRRIVGIRSSSLAPLTLPNVARNVIAHELGHAIGLGHNSDPTLLMCGRPASCRPSLFQSSEPRVFPLNDDEKRRLLALYPPGWSPASK